jgi:hypothetical protein
MEQGDQTKEAVSVTVSIGNGEGFTDDAEKSTS